MEQSPSWETNRFPASQEILPFYGNQSFITAFTIACPLSLSWAHTSGSVHVWGTSLYFVTWYVFTLRSCLHLTQPLKLEYHPLSAVYDSLFNIYSQLPSILVAVPPFSTWWRAMSWWEVPTYLGYIVYYDGFIITNDSEDVLSVCIINTTAFILLDIFHSQDHQEMSHIMPRTCYCKFYVLRAIQLPLRLKALYNSCFQVYGIYMHVKTSDYT